MLYHLFEYLNEQFAFPGSRLFQYISFRASMAIIVSLIISIVFGGRIINKLRKMQIGETVRDLGLEGQMAKQGTPTMGGLMILACILIPTLLFAKVVVAANKREFGMVKHVSKALKAIVKVMVAHGGCVIPHHAHQFKFKLATIHIKKRRALKNITGI